MRFAVVWLCLVLAACGGKPGNERIRIANVGPGLQSYCLPVTLAQELGFYKDEGLDVTIETLPSTAKGLQALVAGSVDVGGLVYSLAVQMAADGQRVRSFFVITNRSAAALAIAPGANEKIRKVEDLKGQVIGIPSMGSGSYTWTMYALARHGLKPQDVSAVAIGVGGSAIAAMESGRIVAAGLNGGDHLRLLRRHPDARILVDGTTMEGTRDVYGADAIANGAVLAKQEWLDGHPDTARRLARVYLRTNQWIVSHSPEEIWAKLPAELRSADRETDLEVLRWSRDSFTRDGRMPAGAPEVARRYMAATSDKVRGAKIDLAATWTNQYLEEK